MSSLYLLFAFIIPAMVNQILSVQHPTNLMTDLIDVRDKQYKIYDQPDSIFQAQLNNLFPKIKNSPVYQDSARIGNVRNQSASALVNELKKKSIQPIEEENKNKNSFIKSTYWFNPVTFFQNKFNHISQTHYNDYQGYRNTIQTAIDKQVQLLISEIWKGNKVDEQKYREYIEKLKP